MMTSLNIRRAGLYARKITPSRTPCNWCVRLRPGAQSTGGGAELETRLMRLPSIELLIVDFSMPGVSGIELLERARAKRPEIRALFITGYVDHTLLNGKFAAEIVVKKPFTMDQLAPAV